MVRHQGERHLAMEHFELAPFRSASSQLTGPAAFSDQRPDVIPDLIANGAHALAWLTLRVFEIPVEPLEPRDVWAALTAAHGDEE